MWVTLTLFRVGSIIYPSHAFSNGFGTGGLNAVVPVYATETAEHTSRGQVSCAAVRDGVCLDLVSINSRV